MFVPSDVKKFAREKGMTISKGFVYGEYDGYMLCIVEGYGIKVLSISCKTNGNENVLKFLEESKLKKSFCLDSFEITEQGIQIVFIERLTAMPKLKRFLNVFIPLLKENGVSGTQICAECSEAINDKETKLVMKNGFVHRVHNDCSQKLLDKVVETKEKPKEKNNVSRGAIGMVLGAFLGGVIFWFAFLGAGLIDSDFFTTRVHAVLLAFSSAIAGILSWAGYRLFAGKYCKACLVLLPVCLLVGFVLGYYLFTVLQMSILLVLYFITKEMTFDIQLLWSKLTVGLGEFFENDSTLLKPVTWEIILLCIAFAFVFAMAVIPSNYVIVDIKKMKTIKSQKILE